MLLWLVLVLVLKIFSTDTNPVYKDISQNIHFDVVLSVFIHPCTKKRRIAQFSIRAELVRLSVSVAEPGCFHRGGQGGASNQPGVAHKSSLFQYKNVVDYKILDYFST